MVFFTCNTCGASLKKNQVEKHYQNECPNCQVLSCMDCGKDFHGDEYAAHTKCISEAQKYQGALYKENSRGAGKGEKKQQEWLEKVKQSVCSASVSPRVAGLLERIADYPNIPRKKAKFENFVRNSFNVRDQRTLSELWEAFSGATSTQQHSKSESTTLEKRQTVSSDGVSTSSVVLEEHTPKRKKPKDRELTSSEGDGASTRKERLKKKIHEHESDLGQDEEVDRPKKKQKKRKHESDHGQGEDRPKKKKKRHKHESDHDSGQGEEVEDTSNDTDAERTTVSQGELEQLTDTRTERKKHKRRRRKEDMSQEVENARAKSCTVTCTCSLSEKKVKHKHSETEDLRVLPPVKKNKTEAYELRT